MNNQFAPILLFCYKRLDTLRLTVEALRKNYLAAQSDLIVFSDASKDINDSVQVNSVRSYIGKISGFRSVRVINSTNNKGLANSIIDGVTAMLQEYEQVIVLEDDLITTPNFLNFMNNALNFYSNVNEVYAACAYSICIENKSNSDVYLHTRATSWGWATWREKWDGVVFDKKVLIDTISQDFSIVKKFSRICGADCGKMLMNSLNGKNDSWYIRWVFSNFLQRRKAVFPYESKVYNAGFDFDATHCNGINTYISKLDEGGAVEFKFTTKYLDDNSNCSVLYSFSRFHKIIFRLKLLCKKNGIKLILNEIRHKIKQAH